MAPGIVGLHDASQPAIQCDVRLGIRGEDKQVGCVVPPANFLLQPKAVSSGAAVSALHQHLVAALAATSGHSLGR